MRVRRRGDRVLLFGLEGPEFGIVYRRHVVIFFDVSHCGYFWDSVVLLFSHFFSFFVQYFFFLFFFFDLSGKSFFIPLHSLDRHDYYVRHALRHTSLLFYFSFLFNLIIKLAHSAGGWRSFQELESEAFFCAVPRTQTHLRHFNARFSFSYFGSFPRMLSRSLRESGTISKTGLVPDEHISCAFLASL